MIFNNFGQNSTLIVLLQDNFRNILFTRFTQGLPASSEALKTLACVRVSKLTPKTAMECEICVFIALCSKVKCLTQLQVLL